VIIPLRPLAAKYGLDPMKTVLHIGGHYGEEFEDYRANGAHHITFVEPALSSFIEMTNRIGNRGLTRLFHTALGPFNGHALMHVERDNAGQSSSLLPPKLHATQYPTIRFTGERELVTVMRADDLFRGEAFDFLAIDVQGYELEVFKGAGETLRTVQAISAEINREELYEGCALVDRVDSFLALLGFDRVETEWCGGTWGEGIYVRRRS
jgi:FkbM family methyltransferase